MRWLAIVLAVFARRSNYYVFGPATTRMASGLMATNAVTASPVVDNLAPPRPALLNDASATSKE